MRTITVNPSTLSTALQTAAPGDRFELTPGSYEALHLRDLRGTEAAPIELAGQAGVVFDGGRRYEEIRLAANKEARRIQQQGRFPGIYEQAHRGFVTLHNCQHIHLKGMQVKGCWPTGIAIDNCQYITLADLTMQEGTFAIFAEGPATKHLTIERCSWVQDISRDQMWRVIPWPKIHGGQNVEDDDHRGLDGEFFRSYGIAGDVTIRHCHIEHAFNGVHMFHSLKDGADQHINRNVYVYANTFSHIRDNAIEPEQGAFNWWVYHNDIHNTHKLFSVECRRMSHVYVFGNTGWFDDVPSRIPNDHNGGSVWKCPRQPLDVPGKVYIFNNSFFIRSPYIKKKRLRNVRHFNNAIQFCRPGDHPDGECKSLRAIFGNAQSLSEKDRFTKEWDDLDIEFRNDIVDHPDFPAKITADGFDIKDGIPGNPGFRDPRHGDLRLKSNGAAIGKGVKGMKIELPDGTEWPLPDSLDLGAFQGETRLLPPVRTS